MTDAGTTDEALMRRTALGDEAAFRLLAERHVGRIRRVALRMLGTVADSDDVAQEALLRIWANAGRWRPERSLLTTWIYTIVYRLCLDRLRAARTVSLDLAMDTEDPALGAFETLARSDDRVRLAAAMRRLQPRQRAALTLFYHEELNGPDAAEVLGVTLRAFWSLLHRARQTVQRQMQISLTS
jgi:RNA polymerase sigma-70 factor, ECF subfamily